MTLRVLALALSLTGLSLSQNPTRPVRPADATIYYEGSVWVLEYSRVKEGAAERVVDALAGEWRARLELARGEGLILSYRIFLGAAADRHDWDLMTLIELRNMAVVDGLQARLGALQAGASSDLTTMREVIGTKVVREALLRPPR